MESKSDAFLRKLHATFKVEAEEHLQLLANGLMSLEQANADTLPELIETLFREAHSLKGASRAIGHSEIERLCQATETVMAALKNAQIAVNASCIDVLHDAVDAMQAALTGDPALANSAANFDLLRRLDHVVLPLNPPTFDLNVDPPSPSVLPTTKPAHTPKAPSEDLPTTTTTASTLRISAARLDAILRGVENLLSSKLSAQTHATELRSIAATFTALQRDRVKIMADFKYVQRGLERGKGKHAKSPSNDKSMPLAKLIDCFTREGVALRSLDNQLAVFMHSMERDSRLHNGIVDGLLFDVKTALMLPLSSLFTPMPKFVRDAAREHGKEANFSLEGGEIEIDRRILDELRDPITHLIRNALDHGVEAPAERLRVGKPVKAKIAVTCVQKESGSVEISISDDGRGIDASAVIAAAVKASGHVDPSDQSNPMALIFESGVSTSPIISDLSGRGLGLAIVREKVEKLGGTVTVESNVGIGTHFRIFMPVTLATYRGVQVSANAQTFIFPTMHVERVMRISSADIKTVEMQPTVQWDGRAIGLFHLADLLELPPTKAAMTPIWQPVVIAAMGSRRLAFAVDEIVAEQEVLVKGLGKSLPRIRNIAGATIAGSGRIVPILHVADLIKSAARVMPRQASREAPDPVRAHSILIAEDSVTSRMMMKNILEAAGYRVTAAADGMEALNRLRTETFDLVISDVDMPRMSGMDLTAHIRADPAHSALPVILVTSLSSAADRARGIDVGASAYIVKSGFDQSNLLDIIERLV